MTALGRLATKTAWERGWKKRKKPKKGVSFTDDIREKEEKGARRWGFRPLLKRRKQGGGGGLNDKSKGKLVF